MIRLENKDCLSMLREVETGSVDLILTDPPYNTTQIEWEHEINLPVIWLEWERIIKDNGVIAVFADEPFTSKLIMSRLGFFKYRITWDKQTATNHLNATKMPLKQTEDIVVFAKVPNGQYTYNPILSKKDKSKVRPVGNGKIPNQSTYGNFTRKNSEDYDPTKQHPTNLLSISSKEGECNPASPDRIHECQKPEYLINYLLLTFSNEGDTVLDCYSGSGTTAVCCARNNREFIGCEKNELHFLNSSARIKRETSKLKLF